MKDERYWIPIIDVATRLAQTEISKSKDEISPHLISLSKKDENSHRPLPCYLEMRWWQRLQKVHHRGREGTHSIWIHASLRIQFEPTPPYTPEQNGVAEHYGGYTTTTFNAQWSLIPSFLSIYGHTLTLQPFIPSTDPDWSRKMLNHHSQSGERNVGFRIPPLHFSTYDHRDSVPMSIISMPSVPNQLN